MLRTIFAAGLIAVSAPALAQADAQSGTGSDTEGMATPPAATTDPAIVVENSPEQQRLVDKAVPTTVATTGEIKLAVDTEWWKFDKDKSGGLDRAEFGQMLYKFQKVAASGPRTTEEAGRAAAAAFMAADTDKDGKVDRDEFVGLLQSPAAG
jgi:hypothetical protein